MKNTILIILLVGILVLGFLFFRKAQDSIPEGYVRYGGEAPFTFTYQPSLFTPDYYSDGPEAYGSIGLSIASTAGSANEGCDMVSIMTKIIGSAPTCSPTLNRSGGVINYCKTAVGQKTGTTYLVNATTPQVCGHMPSQTAQDFVDHLTAELSQQ